MTITFAIPFYRHRDYLERAIRSVLAQTSSDWSLVISDDAGPEGDLTVWLEQFPQREKIHLVRQSTNLGMGNNWNACVQLATGDLLTLLHADDELESNYAEVMIAAAERHPRASVFFCEARIIDAASRPRFSFPDWYKRWLLPARGREFTVEGEEGLRAVMKGNFIMCPTMCYRRAHLPTPAFDARWKQVLDLDFITRELFAGRQFVGLPVVAYRYRRHGENQTQVQSDSLLRFEEERDLFRQIRDTAAVRGWRRAERTAGRMSIIRLNLAFCIGQHVLHLQMRQAWRKIQFLWGL